MSLESAKQFLADAKAGKVGIDVSKVTGVTDHQAAMKYIHSFGYDFTEEEMIQATSDFHGKKISMEGAEAVAGGRAVEWASAGATAAGAGAAAACA